MAEITDGEVRLYRTAGPSLQEKILVAGPVPPEELHFRQNTTTGERFLLQNGFDLPEDAILVINFKHATKVAVTTATKLKLTGLINYAGLDRPRTLAGSIVETDVTKTANVATVDCEIARYQTPKGSSWAFPKNSQLYLYLADA